jgi:Putative peptidoglycan binding domain/Protein of unknown function (DUF1236)
MKRAQLLSGAALAVLLTIGAASAQSVKNEDQNKPPAHEQAGASDMRGSAQHNPDRHGSADRSGQASQRGQDQSSKPSTTGQASKSDSRAGEHSDRMSGANSADDNAKATKRAASSQGKTKDPSKDRNASAHRHSTTGQSTAEDSGRNGAEQNADRSDRIDHADRNRSDLDRTSGSKTGSDQNGATDVRARNGDRDQGHGARLSAEQKDRVSQTILSRHDVPRVDHVDFSVNVGTVVPNHVHFARVPETLVEIDPQWRNDEYFVVRDEIVIVNRDRRIVAVIPSGNSHASTSTSTTTVVDLPRDEIREIQTVLVRRGYLHAEVDGVWGPEWRDALTTYQRHEGVEVTGRIDERTISSLGLSGKIKLREGREGTLGRDRANAKAGHSGSETTGRATDEERHGSSKGNEPRQDQMNKSGARNSTMARPEHTRTSKEPVNEQRASSGNHGASPSSTAGSNPNSVTTGSNPKLGVSGRSGKSSETSGTGSERRSGSSSGGRNAEPNQSK